VARTPSEDIIDTAERTIMPMTAGLITACATYARTGRGGQTRAQVRHIADRRRRVENAIKRLMRACRTLGIQCDVVIDAADRFLEIDHECSGWFSSNGGQWRSEIRARDLRDAIRKLSDEGTVP
jgi:hypothetical protein